MARFLLVLMAMSAVALPQTRPALTPEISASNLPANLPAQPIGPNDMVAVTVYDAPEFSRTLRVGPDGNIRMPMLKTQIAALGKLPVQLESAIAGALKDEQLIIDPFVTVTIVEYFSRPISVAGAVKRPVTFQASGPVSLLDALNRAEGLSDEAGGEILVSRPDTVGDKALVQRIPVKGLIDLAEPEWNVRLTGGEEIRVPEVGRVFVVGNVRRPGAFALRDGPQTSVLRVLALSEGLMPYANKLAYIYRRESGGQELKAPHEITIELRKILDRKADDIPLSANDVLYVPDNSGRRNVMSVIEKMVLFGTSAGATALVYRR